MPDVFYKMPNVNFFYGYRMNVRLALVLNGGLNGARA